MVAWWSTTEKQGDLKVKAPPVSPHCLWNLVETEGPELAADLQPHAEEVA